MNKMTHEERIKKLHNYLYDNSYIMDDDMRPLCEMIIEYQKKSFIEAWEIAAHGQNIRKRNDLLKEYGLIP